MLFVFTVWRFCLVCGVNLLHISAYVTLDDSHEMPAAAFPPPPAFPAESRGDSFAAAISKRCVAVGGGAPKRRILWASRTLMAAAAAMSLSQILV